jgi:allantoicase
VSLMVADITDGDLERKMVHEIPGILDRFLFGPSRGTGATPDEVRQAEQAVSQHGVSWKTLLPKTPLRPGYQETRMHYFTLDEPTTGTHVRVNYYPDGGVARLRLWGDSTARETLRRQLSPMYSSVVRSSACTLVSHSQDDSLPSRQPFEFPELSSSLFGGIGLACSNQHYGHPSNLIQPSLGKDMGDGWETARHPNRPDLWTKNKETGLLDSPLMDWCILKLGSVARDGIERIILDTKHFRGNYPESVRVEGCSVESDDSLDVATPWFPLIPRCRMTPDSEHVFDRHQIANNDRVVSHVKVSIFPDGGLSRVRVYAAPDSLG